MHQMWLAAPLQMQTITQRISENQVANLPPIYVNRQNRKKLRYHHLAHTTGFYWLCEPNPDSEALTGEI